jgi:hypothetical protein
MPVAECGTAHTSVPQRLDALGRGLIPRVAVAEHATVALPPREQLSGPADGKAFGPASNHAAHTHSLESLDNDGPEQMFNLFHIFCAFVFPLQAVGHGPS